MEQKFCYVETRVCYKCKKEKCRSEFYLDKHNKYGLRKNCKSCARMDNTKRDQRKLAQKPPRMKTNDKYSPIEISKFKELLASAKSRAKNHALPYELDLNWILGLYEEQKRVCCLTNIDFDFSFNLETTRKTNPFSPSLDRIDCGRGYVRDNVRLVISAINIALNIFGEQTFAQVAKAYLKTTSNRQGKQEPCLSKTLLTCEAK